VDKLYDSGKRFPKGTFLRLKVVGISHVRIDPHVVLLIINFGVLLSLHMIFIQLLCLVKQWYFVLNLRKMKWKGFPLIGVFL
jgi:hypothetical protein